MRTSSVVTQSAQLRYWAKALDGQISTHNFCGTSLYYVPVNMFGVKRLTRVLDRRLGEISNKLAQLLFVQTRPGWLALRVTKEENGMLTFVIVLPPSESSDVVTRELSVAVAGGPATIESVSTSAAESSSYNGEQGDAIHAELVDIDDAGNRSEPSVFDGTLEDTLAPPAPGALGVRVTAET